MCAKNARASPPPPHPSVCLSSLSLLLLLLFLLFRSRLCLLLLSTCSSSACSSQTPHTSMYVPDRPRLVFCLASSLRSPLADVVLFSTERLLLRFFPSKLSCSSRSCSGVYSLLSCETATEASHCPSEVWRRSGTPMYDADDDMGDAANEFTGKFISLRARRVRV
jgi:hypothetical protein